MSWRAIERWGGGEIERWRDIEVERDGERRERTYTERRERRRTGLTQSSTKTKTKHTHTTYDRIIEVENSMPPSSRDKDSLSRVLNKLDHAIILTQFLLTASDLLSDAGKNFEEVRDG